MKRKPAGRIVRKAPLAGARRAHPRATHRAAAGTTLLMVGTRKGAWLFRSDPQRRKWTIDGPHFLGHIVNHLTLDPRDGTTMLMASKTGHLGPTIFRSTDMGRTWTEASRPPAFPKAAEGARALAVDYTFSLAPAHPSEPRAWYATTCPPGLFRSEDAGVTWTPVAGWNEHPMYWKWNNPDAGTPDGSILQWVTIDPRDAAHMYIVTSAGGVFESHDHAASWRPLNKNVEAVFMPNPNPEFGQDTHCLQMHPLAPDRLYQQSHCGIYRLDRPGDEWVRIGRNMPEEIGDIGFPIVLHPRDPERAWVFPMDGTTVWPRTSPGGRPAVYLTRDAGESWERQDRGLPRAQGWMTVKRQGFCADDRDPLGLYFGTTCGELWASRDEGRGWRQLAAHLPEIYSVAAVSVA
ncbi:MAG TPA: hypothetical protein VMV13_08435 [Candidatus Binataceae bacterium]|nr:hypothetical protein [Candidatus Binataceae bacterium]